MGVARAERARRHVHAVGEHARAVVRLAAAIRHDRIRGAAGERRVARVPHGDSGSDEARATAFIDWLTELKAALGIPAQLAGYTGSRRVTPDDIERLVDVAIVDTCHQTNPRACTADDFRRIFAASM